MKIYTKGGDKGKTSLIGGTRVSKHSLRIESYGTVDELNSHIGLIRDSIEDESVVEQILVIQDRLFTIGSNLAADPEKNKMPLPPLFPSDITYLEEKIDEMDRQLEPLRKFVLPGGHLTISFCHVARTICRRAERLVVGVADEETPLDENILPYLNRLSDYLFVLSRYMTMKLKAKEIAWIPKMEE